MSFANNKILVIDDMNTMRKIICKTVRDMGVTQVMDAFDGNDAWAKIQAEGNAFSLILSDWNMPNCTGIELLKRVRESEKYKNTPFVLLTAEAEAHQISEAVKLGVTSYIIKPFTPEVLKQKLSAILNKVNAAA